MQTILNITTALSILISAGSVLKLMALGVKMAFDHEDKSPYIVEIKNVLKVLVISIVISSGSLIITKYLD